MKSFIALLSIVLFLGCAPVIYPGALYDDLWSSVHYGMTQSEVSNILGPPTDTVATTFGRQSEEVWKWNLDINTVNDSAFIPIYNLQYPLGYRIELQSSITFANGRVINMQRDKRISERRVLYGQ